MRLPTNSRILHLAASALLVIAIVVAATPTDVFAIAQTSQVVAGSVSWLHTCGTEVCDEQNQPVKLLGPNFTGGDSKGLELADIQKIKAMGFNSIRIMMPWRRLQPYGEGLNGIDVRYFTGIDDFPLWHGLDEVMNWTLRENMYLILTLTMNPEPTPSWAFPNITDFDKINNALVLNETASRERTGIINTWKYIANRYRNSPNLVIEPFNELYVFFDAPNYSQAGSRYKTFMEDIISSIESVETRSHLKVVETLIEGRRWDEIIDGAMDVDKTNVAWAFHYYAPMWGWDPNGRQYIGAFTWGGHSYPEGWTNGTVWVTWKITRVCDKIRAWKKPIMITEFGKHTSETYWVSWYQLVLSIASTYNPSGWILHEYGRNPQFNSDINLGNPIIQQLVLPIVMPYFGRLSVMRRS